MSRSRFRSRSFKFRWEHSPAWAAHPTGDLTLNGSASFSGISVAGSSGNHRLHLYVYFYPVRDETEPQSKIGQFCSDLRKPRDYKRHSRQPAESFRQRRGNEVSVASLTTTCRERASLCVPFWWAAAAVTTAGAL